MTTQKKPRAPKKAKATEIPQVKKLARPNIAGQQRFNSVKASLAHVAETLGILHIQTHDRIKSR